MNPFKSILANCRDFRSREPVQPLRDTQGALQAWCRTPMGEAVLQQEQQLLDEQLSCLFGYHFLQLSINPHQRLFEASRISHCFAMGTSDASRSRVQALSELEALPLADSSVDLTLLHHVLEFSQNPQQVLKEAARITIPNGHVIIFGFNPFSPMGLAKPVARLCGLDGIWRRHNLRRGRLEDWLQFLDFNVVERYQGCCNLPINQRTYLKRTRHLSSWHTRGVWGAGNFFCLVARKDVCGVRPLKPHWEQEPVTVPGAVSLPKQSIARAGKVTHLNQHQSRLNYRRVESPGRSILYFKNKR